VAINQSRDLWAQNGDVRLAGQLWMPGTQPRAAVLMIPGSGPSDRHNDVFFPPIREHLLARGIAVASFDKRGVGGSTGDWLSAGILEQADDTLAALELFRRSTELADAPIGLYGHSQGGWVTLEAAGRNPDIALAVTSSGPGVSPAEQEQHAAAHGLRRQGFSPDEVESALRSYDAMFSLIRVGASYSEYQSSLSGEAERRWMDRIGQVAFVPDGEALWNFARLIIDYDPLPAMRRIRCGLLALFGEADRQIPVERSAESYRSAVRDVEVQVFAGADHRCQVGDPPRMADGYLDILAEALLRFSKQSG
jgi:pimeloyl-ACP methyl ester carboxylesterase